MNFMLLMREGTPTPYFLSATIPVRLGKKKLSRTAGPSHAFVMRRRVAHLEGFRVACVVCVYTWAHVCAIDCKQTATHTHTRNAT